MKKIILSLIIITLFLLSSCRNSYESAKADYVDSCVKSSKISSFSDFFLESQKCEEEFIEAYNYGITPSELKEKKNEVFTFVGTVKNTANLSAFEFHQVVGEDYLQVVGFVSGEKAYLLSSPKINAGQEIQKSWNENIDFNSFSASKFGNLLFQVFVDDVNNEEDKRGHTFMLNEVNNKTHYQVNPVIFQGSPYDDNLNLVNGENVSFIISVMTNTTDTFFKDQSWIFALNYKEDDWKIKKIYVDTFMLPNPIQITEMNINNLNRWEHNYFDKYQFISEEIYENINLFNPTTVELVMEKQNNYASNITVDFYSKGNYQNEVNSIIKTFCKEDGTPMHTIQTLTIVTSGDN